MKKFILIVISSLLLYSCFPVKKLEKEVSVTLQSDFRISIENTGISNFSKNHTEEEYKKHFIDELTKSLKLKNITVSTENAAYKIEVGNLILKESTRFDTVKDPKSPDNGKVYELSSGSVNSEGAIFSSTSNTWKELWTGEESRREKFTSFRNIEEIAKGQNKDSNLYREKRFDEHEYLGMISSCAFSAAESITRKIKQNLK